MSKDEAQTPFTNLVKRWLTWLTSYPNCPHCKLECEPTVWQNIVCPECGYDCFTGKAY